MSRKRSVKDFQILDCIGEGSYSKVYKAVYLHNRRTYAVKILSKRHIVKEKKIKYVTIEKTTLNRLGHHPGVVTLYYTFQDVDSLYFVIDYANNGEMLSLLQKLGSFSEALAKYYLVQLVDAVEFIHSKGIIHRDLKPENILLSHDWKLMVTDFGAAKILNDEELPKDSLTNGAPAPTANGSDLEDSTSSSDEGTQSSSSRTGSFVGTAEYVSPELLKYNQCGFECDLWAIGCILYQLIVGRPPFKGTTEYQTFEKIIKLEYDYPANYFVPSTIKKIVEMLLISNPEERLVVADLKKMEWFKNVSWTEKDTIWKKKVPKFENYNPRLYSRQVKAAPQPQSSISRPIAYHYVEPGQKLTSQTSSMPQSVLNRQIAQASNNQLVMNRILTQKLADKNREIKEQQARIQQSHNAAQLASARVTDLGSKNLRLDGGKETLSSPPGSARIPSSPRTDVTINGNGHANGNASVRTPPTSASPKFPMEKRTRSTISSPTLRKSSSSSETRRVSNPSASPAVQTNNSQQMSNAAAAVSAGGSASAGSGMTPALMEMMNPQHSQEAISAAGAIGSLMNHNRSFLSSNSRPASSGGQGTHQQVINPVLLDKTVPRDISNRLMANEYILKLDNIFKSELPHKVNIPQTAPSSAMTLDDVILNKIIAENYARLSRDLKSCILIITSMARLLIFELNSDFQLQGPQSSTQLQALAFYSNVVEIRLTNKNVSMYDYEFDEALKEGYLILELVNLNKLIFLSSYNSKTIVRGGINSNVRVGFAVNPEISWIDSLLKAKDILRQQAKNTTPSGSGLSPDYPLRKSKSHSPGRTKAAAKSESQSSSASSSKQHTPSSSNASISSISVTKQVGKMSLVDRSPPLNKRVVSSSSGKSIKVDGSAPNPEHVASIMKPKTQNHFAAAAAAASARNKKN
ncbi:unnamed protein product [Kuraishia capsulata CBS 1993]|uniref:non-specific serine/threonine protein kinase n=1 Tax=Kuraishia capsulata CBS 1993 TaxID=1382522 RepID=W6MH20_9ASCO|nr:uncharacterized protein KUCA_T00001198001 [Kuraishia capsulata CBS 1993]CDK25231.1 unnamed protein product [Kuraishia capsulata CBS 1993]